MGSEPWRCRVFLVRAPSDAITDLDRGAEDTGNLLHLNPAAGR